MRRRIARAAASRRAGSAMTAVCAAGETRVTPPVRFSSRPRNGARSSSSAASLCAQLPGTMSYGAGRERERQQRTTARAQRQVRAQAHHAPQGAHLRRLRAALVPRVQIPRPGAGARGRRRQGQGAGRRGRRDAEEVGAENARRRGVAPRQGPGTVEGVGGQQGPGGRRDTGGNAAESTYVPPACASARPTRRRAPTAAARSWRFCRRGPCSFRPKIGQDADARGGGGAGQAAHRRGVDRINRKKAAAAGRRRGGGGGGGGGTRLRRGARTADLGGKEGEDMEPEEGRDGSTSRRTTTASTTTTTTPARRTTRGARARKPIGSRASCSTRPTSSRWKWRRRTPRTAMTRTGVSRRRVSRTTRVVLTHFKGEKANL